MKPLLLLLGCAVAHGVSAQLVLDEQFADGGVLEISSPITTGGHVHMIRAEDGTFYATGVFLGQPNSVLTHVLADGTPDPAFGVEGRVVLDSIVVVDLAMQADGKLLCGAVSNAMSSYPTVMLRFQSDGTLDPSFDDDGIRMFENQDMWGFAAIRELADGRIVACGLGNNGVALTIPYKLLSDGSLDATYANNGNTLTGIGGEARIAEGGEVFMLNGNVELRKLDANGFVDATFNNGQGTYMLTCDHCSVRKLALDQQGRVLVLMTGGTPIEEWNDLLVFRTSADGELDTGFGVDGFVRVDGLNVQTTWRAFDVDPLGRPLAAHIFGLNDDAVIKIIRFTTDGAPDPSFGPDGIYTTSTPQPEPTNIGIALAADGTDRVKVMLGQRINGLLDPFVIVGLVDMSTGVAEQTTAPGPILYPNPAGDQLTVTTGDVPFDRIVLRDALGRTVLEEQGQGRATATLDLGSLPSGCYQASIRQVNGHSTTQPVILE